jgi:sugar-phosphatase
VVEDSPAGLAAGLAAEMRVVAVLTSHPLGALAGADEFVDDLTELPAIAARLVA